MTKAFLFTLFFTGSLAMAFGNSPAYVMRAIGWRGPLGNGKDNAKNLVRLAHWIKARPEECSPDRPPAHRVAVASWKNERYGVSAVSHDGKWLNDAGEFHPSSREHGFFCALHP